MKVAQVFNVHQLACQVVNLLAEQQLPMFMAEDVLTRANDYLKSQKVISTNNSGKWEELPQKAEDQLEQQKVITTKINVDLTNVVRKEIKNIIDGELNQVDHSPELKLDKATGLYELKTEHS